MSRSSSGFVEAVPREVLSGAQATALETINDTLAADPSPIVLSVDTINTTAYSLYPGLSLTVEHREQDGLAIVPLPARTTWRAYHIDGLSDEPTGPVPPVSSFSELHTRFLGDNLYPKIHLGGDVMTSPAETESHFEAARQADAHPHRGLVVGSAAVASFAKLTLDHELETGTATDITSRSFAYWVLAHRLNDTIADFPQDLSVVEEWRAQIIEATARDLSQSVDMRRNGVVFQPKGSTYWLTADTIDLFGVTEDEQRAVVRRAQSLATARFSKRKRALIGAAAKVDFGFTVPLEVARNQTSPRGALAHARRQGGIGRSILAMAADDLVANLTGTPDYDNTVSFEYGQEIPDINALAAGLQRNPDQIWQAAATGIEATVKPDHHFDRRARRRVADFALAVATVDFGMPEAFARRRPQQLAEFVRDKLAQIEAGAETI